MKILLVTTYFPPQNETAAMRTYAFARAWSRAGAELTVLTTEKAEEQTGLDVSCEGFRVLEVPYRTPFVLERMRRRNRRAVGAPREAGAERRSSPAWLRGLRRFKQHTGVFGTVRMPDMTDWWVKPAIARAIQTEERWDAVVSSCGPYTTHLVARGIKQAGFARIWAADYRDLWTANPFFSGLFPFTVRERRLEHACFESMDLVTAVSDPLVGWLRRNTGTRTELIYNGYDEELAETISDAPVFPHDGRRRLVYTGVLYPRGRDPSPLFLAMRRLRDGGRSTLAEELRVVVAGPDGDDWRRIAQRHGVTDQVETVGKVDHDRAARMQRDADALLFVDWKDPDAGVLTGKLFDYLFAAAPVLAIGGARHSSAGTLLLDSGRGVHLASSTSEISDWLVRLIDEPASVAMPGIPELLREYTRERQSLRLLSYLEATLAESEIDP